MRVAYRSEAMANDTDKTHYEHLKDKRGALLEEVMSLATLNKGYDDHGEPSWLN